MIHQAVLASQRNPHAELMFFSPDTDVLVLIVAHYRQLCKNTSISMASGVLQIEPIWDDTEIIAILLKLSEITEVTEEIIAT